MKTRQCAQTLHTPPTLLFESIWHQGSLNLLIWHQPSAHYISPACVPPAYQHPFSRGCMHCLKKSSAFNVYLLNIYIGRDYIPSHLYRDTLNLNLLLSLFSVVLIKISTCHLWIKFLRELSIYYLNASLACL